MGNEFVELNKLLYNKINLYSTNTVDIVNEEDLDRLINEINQDFINTGSPYNPSEHNGVRNPFGVMPGWNTFKSWHLLGIERISSNDISHSSIFEYQNQDYMCLLMFYMTSLKVLI